MKYFSVQTIKSSIENLQNISANWLIPAFVFAANDVGTSKLVDLTQGKGTDRFLDGFFNGDLIDLPPFPSGKNLLRPRLKGVEWQKGTFADDFIIRQNTKMWANLFSSRGYREMRQRGEIEGEKATVRLTDSFQGAFEAAIPDSFKFEDFLVWLYAFTGFPDHIESWQELFSHLLREKLGLEEWQAPYRSRFKLDPNLLWPQTQVTRPSDDEFKRELAPRLVEYLETAILRSKTATTIVPNESLSPDDPILAIVENAIAKETSHSFLLAGPPGTGKTRYAHKIASTLTESDADRVLFLQFHPAFGYDDFVEGFRPAKATEADSESGGVRYVLEPRHFLKFAKKASSDPDNRYVLVIDELNRGDVARIFGELLTYLELDYREKPFTLAISGEQTSLPRNLIVIATANPFDRSVTDLDDALLRRFVVVMLEPDRPFLEKYLVDQAIETRVLTRTLRVFDLLSNVFPAGFGHTNFLKVRTIEDLAEVWTGRIQLSLQRTLFHDRQRYEATRLEIEQLLQVDEEAEAIDVDGAQAAG